MPLCVIKNRALIFREKESCNGFLRTFENVREYVRRRSVGYRLMAVMFLGCILNNIVITY